MSTKQELQDYPEPRISLPTFLFVLLAMAIGMLLGILVLPNWAPNLISSLMGPDPKAYWYLSRGTAFVAQSLLWLSMAMGLLQTSKIARSWPGVAPTFAVHEFVSLLGLGFAMFHALVLLGDSYINVDLAQLVIPFASTYQSVWVGIGQVTFFGMLLISLSYYLRGSIGNKTWRVVHYLSFCIYLLSLIHALVIGSDTSLPWAQLYYWISSGILLFLLIYRIVRAFSANNTAVDQ